jgi:hypothetical protein
LPFNEVGRLLGHHQPQTTYRYTNASAETIERAQAATNEFNRAQLAEASASEMVN